MTTLYDQPEFNPKDLAEINKESSLARNEFLVNLEKRVEALESENRRLRAIVSAAKSNPPLELGLALHAPGDMVPSHSATDLLDGNVYIFRINGRMEPRILRKNTTSRPLRGGETFSDGVVDTTLRHDCAPNSFCYVEIL